MPEGRSLPTAEQLEAAAATLRPLERRVFGLAARERLSNPEIAGRLGISVRRAERLLARALGKLDRALTEPKRS